VSAVVGPPVDLGNGDLDDATARIMASIVALLPDEARRRRTPTPDELAATYPPGYRGDPNAERRRRPGSD
jgi:putative phosphoserine phosphatase/1-acylglycerol-3-phosphate O-acyltransferase